MINKSVTGPVTRSANAASRPTDEKRDILKATCNIEWREGKKRARLSFGRNPKDSSQFSGAKIVCYTCMAALSIGLR